MSIVDFIILLKNIDEWAIVSKKKVLNEYEAWNDFLVCIEDGRFNKSCF
jgi:hypothetical protein